MLKPASRTQLPVRSRLEKTGKVTSNYLKPVSNILSVSKTAVQRALCPHSGGDGPGLPSSAPGPSCLS